MTIIHTFMNELVIETPRIFSPLLKHYRYKGAYGGRGSGKSHFFASEWLERNVSGKCDVVCIRENQRSLTQSVKKLLESKISQHNVGNYFEVQDKRILSQYGGITIFEGMQNHTAESIKSLEGYDIAWVEEAQVLSQKSLDMLYPTIRKEGSELWFSWNPRHEDDPIEQFLRGKNPRPDSKVIQVNYKDNPWFPETLRNDMEYDQKRDIEKFRHVWLGEYLRNSEARIFHNWRIEDCEPPDGAIIRQGADWGFSVDPSTLVRCWLDGKNLYVDYIAYMVGCEISYLADLFMTVPDAEKWPLFADSSNPQVISHLRNNGFPKIFPSVKGPNSVKEGIEFLQSYDIIVHPRCKELIDELSLYSYKVDAQTNKILPIIEDKHNHVIDALRYACEGVRRAEKARYVEKKPTLQPASQHGWMG